MSSYHFNWNVISRNLPNLAGGLLLGLEIAVIALFFGTVIGIVGGFARSSRSPILRTIFAIYVAIIRNIPILLFIYFAYFALPLVGIRFLNNFWSAVMALTVYSGAYLTEVFRAGIGSVPTAYIEAGKALGLTGFKISRLIVMPVTFRVVLPSLSNNFISLFKDTSMASAIGVAELTYQAVKINVETFRVIEAWSAAAVMYMVTCYAIAFGLRVLERRYAMVK